MFSPSSIFIFIFIWYCVWCVPFMCEIELLLCGWDVHVILKAEIYIILKLIEIFVEIKILKCFLLRLSWVSY